MWLRRFRVCAKSATSKRTSRPATKVRCPRPCTRSCGCIAGCVLGPGGASKQTVSRNERECSGEPERLDGKNGGQGERSRGQGSRVRQRAAARTSKVE